LEIVMPQRITTRGRTRDVLTDIGNYGTRRILNAGRYKQPHVVAEAARVHQCLVECEDLFVADVAKIDASKLLTEDGKAIERRKLAATYLERVEKIAGMPAVRLGERADSMRAERTAKAPPVDAATKTWIWTQLRNASPDDRGELLTDAVLNNDQVVFDAIMSMPRTLNPLPAKSLELAKAQWDQNNLAGASDEERDIRQAKDVLDAEIARLTDRVKNECGTDVEPGDPLDKYEKTDDGDDDDAGEDGE
jgi:hypothetical protein